jgi:hypothetical protein
MNVLVRVNSIVLLADHGLAPSHTFTVILGIWKTFDNTHGIDIMSNSHKSLLISSM